ncbi:hypothetical protein BD770DRAFT_330623, partial [Pilaira anomala]
YDLYEGGHAIDCSGHGVLDMLPGILNEGWKRSFLGGSRKRSLHFDSAFYIG